MTVNISTMMTLGKLRNLCVGWNHQALSKLIVGSKENSQRLDEKSTMKIPANSS